TTRTYPLSLHGALPIYGPWGELTGTLWSVPTGCPHIHGPPVDSDRRTVTNAPSGLWTPTSGGEVDNIGDTPARHAGLLAVRHDRSEEHTSELQSRENLV